MRGCSPITVGPVPWRLGRRRSLTPEVVLDPDDVADAVCYLAGAGFVTGTTLVVDGGRLLQSGRHGLS